MMSRKLSIVIAAAFVVAGAASARAEEEEAKPYATNGAYVSAGAVYGIENNNTFEGSLSDSFGYDLRGGYGMHDMFQVEVEWQSLLNFDRGKTVDPVTGQSLGSLEERALTLNGRFTPLTGRIQPYALIGGGWLNVQTDHGNNQIHESAFGMRFGLGVAAYFTQRTGAMLEAAYLIPLTGNLAGGDRFDVIPITLSLFFKFK